MYISILIKSNATNSNFRISEEKHPQNQSYITANFLSKDALSPNLQHLSHQQSILSDQQLA